MAKRDENQVRQPSPIQAREYEPAPPRAREGGLKAKDLERFAAVLDDGVWICNWPEGRLLFVNPGYVRILGESQPHLLGDDRHWGARIHPEDRAKVLEVFKGLPQRRSCSIEFRVTQPDGNSRHLVCHAYLLADDSADGQRLAGIARDVTQTRRAEQILRDERNFFTKILDGLPGHFYMVSDEGKVLRWNQPLIQDTGLEEADLNQRDALELFPEPDRPALAAAMAEVLERGTGTVSAHCILRDGRRVPFLYTGRRVMIEGKPGIVGLGIDIQDRKALEDTLTRQRNLLNSIIESSSDRIALKDADFVYRSVNPAFCAHLGLPESGILGKTDFDLMPPGLAKRERQDDIRVLTTGETLTRDEEFDGEEGRRWLQMTRNLVRDAAGSVQGVLCSLRDITRQKLVEQELRLAYRKVEQLAITDPLTGLANRRFMYERLDYEKRRYERNREPFTLILADIDQFKSVNDRYGHPTGDKVLRTLASLLQSMVRQQDTVSRWGGEEFLILLPGTNLEGGNTLAEKIRARVAQTPFVFDPQSLSISLTLGVTVHDRPLAITECIRVADEALYKGKSTGRNRVIAARA